MKHVPFSSAMFTKAKIVPGPLTFISNKVLDLRSLGHIGNQLTFNQTKDKISLIQSHLPLSVSSLVHILILLLMFTIPFRQRQGVTF